MEKVEAVNMILSKLEEHGVTSVDDTYPTLAVVLPYLDQHTKTLQMKGWWFNKFKATYYPDINGRVVTPANVLVFYPDSHRYTWNGTYVVDEYGEDALNVSVKGKKVVELDFEVLPESAQFAIAYSAALEIYTNEIGTDQNAQAIAAQFGDHYGELSMQHTRQSKASGRRKRAAVLWRSSLRA